MKISVITHPNSKKPRVEMSATGLLHVYVSAAPLEGKANLAVLEALAHYLSCRKSALSLVSGHQSKHKVFDVEPTVILHKVITTI